jgi:hypothetical protein
MDEIISYKMCAVKVRNAKLRNYLITLITLHYQSFCDHIGNFAWVNFEGFVRTV